MGNGFTYCRYSNFIQIRNKREGEASKDMRRSILTVDYERLKEEMSELYGKDAKIQCQEMRVGRRVET